MRRHEAGQRDRRGAADLQAAHGLARALREHEHVVPILDFQVTDSHACLVMEFIPGLNLRRWCETHRLGLQDRVRLIAQVARASGWFHALGIVHRDLKPQNIWLQPDGRGGYIVKVLDFGLAKAGAATSSPVLSDSPTVSAGGGQALVLIEKTARGMQQSVLEAVHFVPLKSGIA